MLTAKEVKSTLRPYMKEKDPTKAHAVLSASGAFRWLKCPGSVRLSEGLPTEENEWSRAGTNAHTLLQFILEHSSNWEDIIDHPASLDFREYIDFSNDQLVSVARAADYVSLQKSRRPGAQLLVEQKLELKGVGFGTADVVLYEPFGVLHVMDYKHGKYKVEPEYNHQMLYYAVAAADLFGWDFREVRLTIMQPNAPHRDGVIRSWITTPEVLENAQTMFRLGAARTKKKDAPLVRDDRLCWFCPARIKCPKQMELKYEKAREMFQR